MRLVALGVLAAAALATAAQADVRYDFSGSLTTTDFPGVFATEAGLATGTGGFSGHVTFSDLAPDQAPSPTAEAYEALEFELIIGSYTFNAASVGVGATIASIDTVLPAFSLNFSSGPEFSLLDGESMVLILTFADAVPGLEQNPSLVGATANLFLTSAGADFLFADGSVDEFVTTSSAAVPEPATWAMMIGGFAVIGATMRSRRRRQLAQAFT